MTSLESSPNLDLEQFNFEQLVTEKDRLITPYTSVSQMTIDELTRFSAICDKLRLTARPAGKPAGSGTRRPSSKKKAYSEEDIL